MRSYQKYQLVDCVCVDENICASKLIIEELVSRSDMQVSLSSISHTFLSGCILATPSLCQCDSRVQLPTTDEAECGPSDMIQVPSVFVLITTLPISIRPHLSDSLMHTSALP